LPSAKDEHQRTFESLSFNAFIKNGIDCFPSGDIFSKAIAEH